MNVSPTPAVQPDAIPAPPPRRALPRTPAPSPAASPLPPRKPDSRAGRRVPPGEGFGGGFGGAPGAESAPGGGGGIGGGMPAADAEARQRAKERARARTLERHEREAEGPEGDGYGRLVDNPFIVPAGEAALSTFAVDVDTASYANVRRLLRGGHKVPPGAVRIEELINYFSYDYEPASGPHPFSVNVETGPAPWAPEHRLVRIGLQGEEVDLANRPSANIVFLLDVSGSMNRANKLPLVKQALEMLVDNLTSDDRVSIVVYAGAAGVVLEPTWCDRKDEIIGAFARLQAGGSTAGGAGIEAAYALAERTFIRGGINRVILCTDGDFNVGTSNLDGLIALAEEKRKSGVFLSVLGFGGGNFQDHKMEELSNAGNGNFAYIDSQEEAHKVLVEEMSGTLMTIAKDVKIQVEFNPAHVQAYRLIGYANRLLKAEDFRNDAKDAGEIGSGHSVTALYEVVPPGVAYQRDVPELEYQKPAPAPEGVDSENLLTVRLRYKEPAGDKGIEFVERIVDGGKTLTETTADFRFAAAVASFGMMLRDSEYKGGVTWSDLTALATGATEEHLHPVGGGPDTDDDTRGTYRLEFIELLKKARALYDR